MEKRDRQKRTEQNTGRDPKISTRKKRNQDDLFYT